MCKVAVCSKACLQEVQQAGPVASLAAPQHARVVCGRREQQSVVGREHGSGDGACVGEDPQAHPRVDVPQARRVVICHCDCSTAIV